MAVEDSDCEARVYNAGTGRSLLYRKYGGNVGVNFEVVGVAAVTTHA